MLEHHTEKKCNSYKFLFCFTQNCLPNYKGYICFYNYHIGTSDSNTNMKLESTFIPASHIGTFTSP